MTTEYDYAGDPEEIQEEEIEEEVEEVEEDYEEDDEELDFAKLFGDADEEEPEEEPVEDPEDEVKSQDPSFEYDEESGTWIDTTSGTKLLPQDKVNEIIGSARIKGREYEENIRYLEEMTGMPFHQLTEKLQQDAVQQFAEEKNWEPEDAHKFFENKKARELYEKELLSIRHQQQAQEQMIRYNQEKAQHISNPLVKRYEQEIDAIARGGENVSWSVAMNHVLGQKAVEGELGNVMQQAAQKRMSKTKKPMMAPETGGGHGASQSIPKEIEFFAKQLGEDPKESFKEYQKIQKER